MYYIYDSYHVNAKCKYKKRVGLEMNDITIHQLGLPRQCHQPIRTTRDLIRSLGLPSYMPPTNILILYRKRLRNACLMRCLLLVKLVI